MNRLGDIEYVKGNLYVARNYLREAIKHSEDKFLKDKYREIVGEIKKLEAKYKFFMEKRAVEAKDVFDELIPVGGNIDIGGNKKSH